jgi:single-strand DNA-binding protein
MLNSVTLIGRMGTDLRKKVVVGGKRLVTFSLATTEFVPGVGAHTEWHQVVAWAQFCDEAAATGARKGDQVYIEGALRTSTWFGKDGKNNYRTQIQVSKFKLLERKR